MAKRLDKSALVMIARVLKDDITRTLDGGAEDYAGWAYETSRALSLVIENLGHGGLNPFNDGDWQVIVGEE